MYIIPHKSIHNDTMFIFEFDSKVEDFDPTMAIMRKFAKEIDFEDTKKEYLRVLDTLEKRCYFNTGKDCEVTSMLIESEMAVLCMGLVIIQRAEDCDCDIEEFDDVVCNIRVHNDNNSGNSTSVKS